MAAFLLCQGPCRGSGVCAGLGMVAPVLSLPGHDNGLCVSSPRSVQADGIVPWYLKGSFPHGQIPKRDSCRPRHWGQGPAACRSDRTEMAQAHGSGRRSRRVPPLVVAGYRRIWLCMYPDGCFNLFPVGGMADGRGLPACCVMPEKLGKHQEKAFFKKRQSGSLDPPCCHHKGRCHVIRRRRKHGDTQNSQHFSVFFQYVGSIIRRLRARMQNFLREKA